MTDLPRYRCIKVVQAAEIEHIDTSGPGLAQIILVGHPPRRAKEGMFHRYMPRAGDFLVVYDDGYESVSPRKAFLEGYVPEKDYPRKHQFWGAGEPDCPPDLKAGNGELHTLRCKVCGGDGRRPVCDAGSDK